MKLFLKIFGWTLMAIVLFAVATLVAVTRMLTPERLTPISQTLANKYLNADVSIGRMELDLKGSYPFLTLQVDSLAIISRDIKNLPEKERNALPQWADTLARADRISAGINLPRIAAGVILLNDVEIHHPSANILIANDSLNNFTLTAPSNASAADSSAIAELPDLRIHGFRIIDAGTMRFKSLPDDLALSARLTSASLRSLSDPSEAPPAYNINLYADFQSPLLAAFNADTVSVGFDGDIDWKPISPLRLQLSNFTLAADSMRVHFSTSIDARDSLVVESFDGSIDPLPFSYMLARMPKELAMPKGIRTDAAVAISAKLNRPYTVGGAELIPYADIAIDIPDCSLRWQRLDIRHFALSLKTELRGDNLNLATLNIDKCLLAGPATQIELEGKLSQLTTDPLFDGRIDGHTALDRLPSTLTDSLLQGGAMSGRIDLHTDIKARPSMFSRNNFHKLKVDGRILLSDFSFLSADTLTSVQIANLWANLGTNTSLSATTADGTENKVDSLLTASIETDSISASIPGLEARMAGFKIGVGAENKALSADTTAIIPLGGRMHCTLLNVDMPADSVRLRVRDINGGIGLRRFQNDAHRPQFSFNTSIGSISAATPSARFMARGNKLSATVHLQDDSPTMRERKRLRAIADSIASIHPDIPSDSITALALARRDQLRGNRRNALKPDSTSARETIDWGLDRDARRLLLDWAFSGNLASEQARLFTTAFPLRNSMEHLNLRFDNDSIVLSNVACKVGRSDFTISGTVSNMQLALTSRRPSPLKVSLDLTSDTLDVNQIAKAFFSGAASRQDIFDTDLDSEALEIENETDSIGPLIVPSNIDATFRMRARNILYADFLLHDLRGMALLRDGALNLRSLRASSQIGSIDFSALYAAPKADDMRFAFGLDLKKFRVGDFLQLMPAIDSIMPMMGDFDGVVNASIAATSDITKEMDLDLASLEAAVKIEGDSLVVLDEETFKTMSKWLMFKNKNQNLIKHMAVELTVQDNVLTLYPFMFDMDRYRLGVQGHNDLALNFDYHVSVLKSPLPFKFGINIKGNADDYKIRVGKARFDEKQAAEQRSVADTTRVNLIREVENVFRRGISASERPNLKIDRRPAIEELIDAASDTISAADSLMMRQQGYDL